MFPVGPRNTEYASTNGTISATSDDQHEVLEEPEEPEREERDRRRASPTFAITSRSPSSASTATTASPAASGSRPRADASGSTIQSKRKTPGISTSARRATSHQRERPRNLVGREVPRGAGGEPAGERERCAAGSVRGQLCPPGAERLERVPERGLGRGLVERGVDVGDDERLDRRREPLELARASARRAGRAGTRGRSGRRARRRPSARPPSARRCAARGSASRAPPRRRRRRRASRSSSRRRPSGRRAAAGATSARPARRGRRTRRPPGSPDACGRCFSRKMSASGCPEPSTGTETPPAARAISSPRSLISAIAFCRYFSWISSVGTAVTGGRMQFSSSGPFPWPAPPISGPAGRSATSGGAGSPLRAG